MIKHIHPTYEDEFKKQDNIKNAFLMAHRTINKKSTLITAIGVLPASILQSKYMLTR